MMMKRALIAVLLCVFAVSALAQSIVNSPPVQRGPDVDLNFAASAYYQAGQNCSTIASCITVVRASSGYIDDTSGTWTLFGNNVARISNKGLLVEEARTNVATNSSFTGASVPSTPPTGGNLNTTTGITVTIAATGTVNGLPYIDMRVQGNHGSAGNLFPGPVSAGSAAVTVGDSWTLSGYFALVGGSLTNVTALFHTANFNTTGNISVELIGAGLNSTLTRYAVTTTVPATNTAFSGGPFFNIGVNSGAVDFTLRYVSPQLEKGAFATSPIQTSSGSVTRAADVVTLTNVPVFGSAVSGYTAMSPIFPSSATVQIALQIDNSGDNANRIRVSVQSSGFALGASPGPSPNANGFNGSLASNRLAFAVTSGDGAGSGNGTAALTSATVGFPTLTTPTVWIGQRDTGAQSLNGYISRIALWPTTRLPNAQLQNITSANWASNDNLPGVANDNELLKLWAAR